jgi:hypothetical protein
MPCKECGEHLVQNLENLDVRTYLTNNHDLFFFTYVLHDMVNQQHNIHKPDEPKKVSPNFDDVKAEYFRALVAECQVCHL